MSFRRHNSFLGAKSTSKSSAIALEMNKSGERDSRLEADFLGKPESRNNTNTDNTDNNSGARPTTAPTESLCWYMVRLKRDRNFWEERYRAEAKARVETHDIQRTNKVVNEQARLERAQRIRAEKELAALKHEHSKTVQELETFRNEANKYVVEHVAPAHWRQDLLEEQNQKLSAALDTVTAERDALIKARNGQERLLKAMRSSLARKVAVLDDLEKADLARRSRYGTRANNKRHTTVTPGTSRRRTNIA
jgi:hypothetical protein